MTRQRYNKRIRQIADAVRRCIIAFADNAAESGAFDLDDAADDFHIPKQVATAALEVLAAGHAPDSRKDKAQVRNIKILTNSPTVQ